MNLKDVKKTCALFEAAAKQLKETSKKLEEVKTESDKWKKHLAELDRKAAGAIKVVEEVVKEFQESRREILQLKSEAEFFEKQLLVDDAIAETMRKRISEGYTFLNELMENYTEKHDHAEKNKNDKKAKLELELSEKALDKASRDTERLEKEYNEVMTPNDVDRFASMMNHAKEETKKYERALEELVKKVDNEIKVDNFQQHLAAARRQIAQATKNS